MKALSQFGAGLAIVAAACPAAAEERITSFVSDVRVEANGGLDVVETIRLISEGHEIKRGIQRDFPTRYPGGFGRRIRVGFQVVDVARDGHGEPYRLIGMGNGKRIRIGDADTLLPPGEHVYRIHYRTNRQLGFFKDFDELYWNATGTGWTFPIEQAEARITLPAAAKFGSRAVYTGYQGATNRDASVIAEQPGRIVLRTTGRLNPRQGLTVAVAWPKGVVTEPGPATRLGWALRDNGAILLALAGLLAILGHVAITLRRVKRNPDRRPIVPLFSPPDDLSAAAVRLIWRMGFDDRTFSAAIVDAGVRGRLRIIDIPGSRSLERTDGTAAMPPAEAGMLKSLFRKKRTVALKQASHETLSRAREVLMDKLNEAYGEGRYFSVDAAKAFHGWGLIVGLLASLGLVLAVTMASVPLAEVLGIAAAIAAAIAVMKLLSRGRRTMPADHRWRLRLSWLGTALILIMLFLLLGDAIVNGLSSGNAAPMAIPLIAIPFVIYASANLRGPTAIGWPMRNRILGFRHYLSVTEEDRLEKLNPPEKTAALFERYLPYAIALGVENSWAKRFSGILTAAAADPEAAQGLGWYSGSSDPWRDPGSFTSSVGSSLSSTIASAAEAPESSSGSSGSNSSSSSSSSSDSGSSGGGGGGGGGSGW